MPRPHLTPGKDPVPIVQEAEWASEPVWTGAENLAPQPVFDPRTVQHVGSRYTDYATRPIFAICPPLITISTHVTFSRCFLPCLTSYMTFLYGTFSSPYSLISFLFHSFSAQHFVFSFHTYIHSLLHMQPTNSIITSTITEYSLQSVQAVFSYSQLNQHDSA